ncbi:hypothetical protein QR680_005974 [Steinernema hermaphroditum]|uniref:Uncharacterized protein n=1 Tax=Steinernema hermaphroditum TaxID=289476 RepID=A0AA39HW36_9BILA|nr:hypothetical protein QR680_005974 [Steinernema hermaphroditum]
MSFRSARGGISNRRGQRGGTPTFLGHPGRNTPQRRLIPPDFENCELLADSQTPHIPPPLMATPSASAVLVDRYWIPKKDEDEREKLAAGRQPTIFDRRKASTMAVDFLVQLLSMGDATTHYREGARPIWASLPKNQKNPLSETCLKVIHEVPSAWPLALDFVCQLVHEATHFTLLNRESRTKNDISVVDEALHTIVAELRTIVEGKKFSSRCLELLGVLCNLFADLCRCNRMRPSLHQMYVEGILNVMKDIPAVKLMLDLLDEVLTYLLEETPEACTQTLISASKHGFNFEWIWFHVVLTFPSSIVQHLLWHGMQDFRAYVQTLTQCGQMNAAIFAKQHDEYHTKFTAIKDVFMFLAKRMNAELKSCALKMIKKNLEDRVTEKQPDDMSVLFMLRLIAYTRDILDFLINDIVNMVNYKNVLNATRMALTVDRKFILQPNQTYIQFFTLVVQALNNAQLSKLITKLAPIAYAQHSDDLGGNCGAVVSDGAAAVLDEIANSVLVKVHAETGNRVIVDCHVLKKYTDDSDLLQKAIDMLFTVEKSRIFHMKLLHALCLENSSSSSSSCSQDIMSEVIMRCLCTAEDEKQLAIFVSFLETVLPFSVDCLRKAVVTKGTKRERKTLASDFSDFKRKNLLWIRNLKTLLEWERGAADSQIMKYIGVSMMDNMGQIMSDVLSWALDSLAEAYERREEHATAQEVPSIVNLVTSFIFASNHAAYLSNKDTYQIIAKTAGILTLMLRYIGMERFEVIDAYHSFLECIMKFFLPLPTRMDQRTQLIIHLLSEVFEMSAELFGSCRDLCAWEEEAQYAAGCETVDFDIFGLFNGNNEPDDIMKQLETLTTESERASKVAHAGKLVKKGKAPKNRRFNPSAIELTQRFCGDAALSLYEWNEWEYEREQISKYVIIAKTFNENGVASDILTFIAREVSIWFAFPLVKALLAVVINDIESKSSRQRNDRIREESVLQLDKSLSYFVRALILPTRLMCCTMKVVSRVTVHEASVLLVNLWKYLADVAPTHQALMVDRTITAVSDFGRFGPKTLKAAVPWKQTMIYLIQKYSKDLGHFVQLLKREHFLADEEDSDDWSIEYTPPFLFIPDMKR